MRYQVSIVSMMAVIVIIAFSLAALRINSAIWGGIVLLTTLAVLCTALFMCVAYRGPGRLAWIGCAAFGWPCFILGFAPLENERLGPLHMTEILEEAIPYINPALAFDIRRLMLPDQDSFTESLPRNIAAISPRFQRYRQSSHSVLTLGFAALGGILGCSRAVRRDSAGEMV